MKISLRKTGRDGKVRIACQFCVREQIKSFVYFLQLQGAPLNVLVHIKISLKKFHIHIRSLRMTPCQGMFYAFISLWERLVYRL